MIKKYFNKELVVAKEDFESSTKCRICDITIVDADVKVRGHCQMKNTI